MAPARGYSGGSRYGSTPYPLDSGPFSGGGIACGGRCGREGFGAAGVADGGTGNLNAGAAVGTENDGGVAGRGITGGVGAAEGIRRGSTAGAGRAGTGANGAGNCVSRSHGRVGSGAENGEAAVGGVDGAGAGAAAGGIRTGAASALSIPKSVCMVRMKGAAAGCGAGAISAPGKFIGGALRDTGIAGSVGRTGGGVAGIAIGGRCEGGGTNDGAATGAGAAWGMDAETGGPELKEMTGAGGAGCRGGTYAGAGGGIGGADHIGTTGGTAGVAGAGAAACGRTGAGSGSGSGSGGGSGGAARIAACSGLNTCSFRSCTMAFAVASGMPMERSSPMNCIGSMRPESR